MTDKEISSSPEFAADRPGGRFRVVQDKTELEHGEVFAPNFGSDGLVTAIAVDAASGGILMVAHMNADAVAATLETGIATYWSRSRGKIWVKGESSGTRQRVVELRTDCDQDALIIRVEVEGAGVACHNGYKSCFYRIVKPGSHDPTEARLELDGGMQRVDPSDLYPV